MDIPSDPGLAISLCDPTIAANKYAVTETDSQFGEIKEELTELTVNLYYQNGRAKKNAAFGNFQYPFAIIFSGRRIGLEGLVPKTSKS